MRTIIIHFNVMIKTLQNTIIGVMIIIKVMIIRIPININIILIIIEFFRSLTMLISSYFQLGLVNWNNILNFQYQLFVVCSNCNEIHPIAFRRVFQTRHKLNNFAFHLTLNHTMDKIYIEQKVPLGVLSYQCCARFC